MSSLKPITINRLLRLLDIDEIEQFRSEFSHIFIPNEASLMLSGHSRGFIRISRELIIQHWITADALQLATKMSSEVMRKENGLSDAIAKGHDNSYAPVKNSSDYVDPEFGEICALWFREAQKERETLDDEGEEFCPENSEMGMAYHLVLNLAEQTIEDFRTETIKRAICGLYRILENNLKALKDADNNQNQKWVDPKTKQGEKESQLVYLLREFETNIPSLDTRPFRRKLDNLETDKKLAPITKIRKIRNKIEHESNVDLSHITEKDLIRFFEEIKCLFEAIEKACPNLEFAGVRVA